MRPQVYPTHRSKTRPSRASVDTAVELEPGRPLARLACQRFEPRVVVARVVVEQEQTLRSRALREREGVAEARVTPASAGGVFVVGVLGIVDEGGGATREPEPGDPVRRHRGEARAEPGLVVGQVAEAGPGMLDPVAERGSAMGDQRPPHPELAEAPAVRRHLLERDPRGQVSNLNRRERGRQVARQALAQGDSTRRPPDRDLDLGIEQRREEEQPLDVVEVQVGEQYVQSPATAEQVDAKPADAAPRVENQLTAIVPGDLDAGGVPTERRGLRAGRRNRAAHAPRPNPHRPYSCWSGGKGQNTTIAPW